MSQCGAPSACRSPACCPLQLGGSGVLVQPMTYIFDEEPERWTNLLQQLGLAEKYAAAAANGTNGKH